MWNTYLRGSCRLVPWEKYRRLAEVGRNIEYALKKERGLYYGLALLALNGIRRSLWQGLIVDDLGQQMVNPAGYAVIPLPADVVEYWRIYAANRRLRGVDSIYCLKPGGRPHPVSYRKYSKTILAICGSSYSYTQLFSTRIAQDIIRGASDLKIARSYYVSFYFVMGVRQCLAEKYMRESILPSQRRRPLRYLSISRVWGLPRLE